MLSNSRIVLRGQSAYAHEQQALAFLRDALPDRDPYHLWELVELVDPPTGRLFEIDALVLGYSALYLIEIKSGPGVYEGDSVDWYRTERGGPKRYMDPPLRLTNFKAKVLKSLLQSKLPHRQCPRVEPLVFLSAEDLELRFTPNAGGDLAVVTRKTLLDAVKNHKFPGSIGPGRLDPINAPTMKAVAQALEAIGVRPSKGIARVGAYELGAVLEEGAGYQDRHAVHAENHVFQRRARIYLVPQQTSVERRQQLRRAADREARLLEDVKEHPNVLRIVDYVTDSPLGPAVLFDAFDGVRLDAFLRSHPQLSFGQRVQLIERIGRALAHCHRKSVTHGGLAPSAVLVREEGDGGLQVRLYNFQLGFGADVTPTTHWSAQNDEPWALYQAPEARENPAMRGPMADIFSLGALAYLVLTGRPPADSVLALDERLAREHELDPRAASDGVPSEVANAVALATASKPVNRADDVNEWVELLLETATSPAPRDPSPEVSPLDARAGDILGNDLLVTAILGQGASSRVLEVDKDGRAYALKVALDAENDERLNDEARALARLRHSRIVQYFETRTLGGRTCLLLAKAGEQTLQRSLAREGAVSLDYASRYGEDLLDALRALEEEQILHRDIKPANLGVGATGKRANHLTLFDFSLALDLRSEEPSRIGRSQINISTAVYRDPFLRMRGGWDAAADRWAAAITLHEMLTGVRPTFSGDGAPALDPDAEIVLAAERFDASVREHLIPFFEKALHREVAQRFESADAMFRAWGRCFDAPAIARPVPVPVPAPEPAKTGTQLIKPGSPAAQPEGARAPTPEGPHLTGLEGSHLTGLEGPHLTTPGEDDGEPGEGPTGEPTLGPQALSPQALAAIGPETPIEALPLSVRARNALDRAGLRSADELLVLPDNRLSAVRGVGRQVAKEIFDFRDAWREARRLTPEPAKPFFPGYRGENVLVTTAGLDERVALVLRDAGLHTLCVVASASEAQIQTLAARAGVAIDPLRQLLERENARANARRRPTTLDGWIDALLPDKKAKSAQNLRALFGLSGPFAGRIDLPVAEVAAALGVTPANIYVQLGRERDRWAAHAAMPELRRVVRGLVEEAGGALPVRRAASALLELVPRDPATPRERAMPQAAALARIVGIVEREEEGGLCWARLDSGPWLLLREDLESTVQALGRAADELASRSVLASPGEVARVLGAIVENTALQALTAERLTDLATLASRNAARSARLEIYPRGLDSERALALSIAVLTGALAPSAIQQRVAARYPEATPLPDRPELDELVGKLGLRWVPEVGVYLRQGEGPPHTHVLTATSYPSVTSSQKPFDPRHIALRELEERLRITLDRRTLKVLGVRSDLARDAALKLTRVLDVRRVALDAELLREMRALMKENGVDPAVVHRTDRVGPGGDDWPHLRELAERAAERVARALLPAKEPLLLIQPGLVERYALLGFLRQLVAASRDPKSAAMFLLVPDHDHGGVPRINGRLSIPEVGLPHMLWISPSWIRHEAAA